MRHGESVQVKTGQWDGIAGEIRRIDEEKGTVTIYCSGNFNGKPINKEITVQSADVARIG